VVGAAGLEPATLCLEGRCSIQLSYAPTVLGSFYRSSALFIRENTVLWGARRLNAMREKRCNWPYNDAIAAGEVGRVGTTGNNVNLGC
jgi:hypothetical protein